MNPAHIFGIHDFAPAWARWIQDAGVTGWAVTTHAVEGDLDGDSGHDYTEMADYGVTPIARLNFSHHGNGTIPPDPDDWPAFAERLARFVANSDGCRWWTVANEVNLAREWGRDQPVMPQDYGHCYRLCYDAIKSAVPDAQIAPAAIGPWNVDSGKSWIWYFIETIYACEDMIDWINLHTYSRGYGPAAITDRTRMDPPYQEYHSGFQAYKDFLDAVPTPLRGVPVHVTETNGNRPWVDENTGWVQAAYAEINHHNQVIGSQKIHSLCLFRWPRFDEDWQFETKTGVHADFKAALTHAYRIPATLSGPTEPAGGGQAEEHTLHIPKIGEGNGPSESGTDPVPREWDPRLTELGVEIEPPPNDSGSIMEFRVIRAEWMNEQESGGRHHIYVDVLDEDGERIAPIDLYVEWPSGNDVITTEAKPGELYAANFPMSPGRNAFSIEVTHPHLSSERVTGIGMGALTPDGFNAGIHTSTAIVFQQAEANNSADVGQPPAEEADANGDHSEKFRVDDMPNANGLLDPLVMEAFIAIESGGRAFGPDGRLLIRFEAHIFMRRAKIKSPVIDHFQFSEDRPWMNQMFRTTPTGTFKFVHASEASEWEAFEMARGMEQKAAYESISMGLPQIMGFNHERIGYVSARAMFEAFQASRDFQVIGMINFVLTSNQLYTAIRQHDWHTIATLYNGPGQAEYYAGLLRSKYEELSSR